MDRRWFDGPGSRPAYFDRAQLAALVAELASGAQPGELRPKNAPDLPRNSLVSVKFWHNDWPQTEATRPSTPPIRAHDGRWYVGVVTMAAGFLFLPVADVKLRPDPRARRVTQAKPQKTAA